VQSPNPGLTGQVGLLPDGRNTPGTSISNAETQVTAKTQLNAMALKKI